MYRHSLPPTTDDGWETASIESARLDAAPVVDFFNRIEDGTYPNIHSALLVRNGKLVVEEYFAGTDEGGTFHHFDANQLCAVHSVTKSVTSILIGIAIDRQLIKGVEEPLSSFFPEYADLLAQEGKGALQLKHFLTMTAGLAWDEWSRPYGDLRNDMTRVLRTPDPIRAYLSQPVAAKPGTQFAYSGPVSLTLGEIIRHVSGIPLNQFAERYLFGPLGITNYSWKTYSNGMFDAGGGLALRPRDMAKIGRLFLEGGNWNGQQIVSKQWVHDSTQNYIDRRQLPSWNRADGFGYGWWLRTFSIGGKTIQSHHAAGRGGQFIFVFPEQQLVAVFTGWNEIVRAMKLFDMLERYVLPAVGD